MKYYNVFSLRNLKDYIMCLTPLNFIKKIIKN